MVKRKRSTAIDQSIAVARSRSPQEALTAAPVLGRAQGTRKGAKTSIKTILHPEAKIPGKSSQILDGTPGLPASPDADSRDHSMATASAIASKRAKKGAPISQEHRFHAESSVPPIPGLSDVADIERQTDLVTAASQQTRPVAPPHSEVDDEEESEDEAEVTAAISRPAPVDSAYLPLPWKGRLGYACLNTYLRSATPPVFSSRTCRIASILDHRHPLADSTQPEHPTKNRPDKTKPASVERGQRYVEALALANVQDIPKMLRWNDKYGIKFMRLSSEMFPFASHGEFGYKLEPFASEALAEAGRIVALLGHRVTTHPGQYTQLGSPRKQVIDASIRDLEYHADLLRLLKLPEQLDRDAVMVLHMGGMFGDKAATLDRFRENYSRLSQDIKNRLVLENDDMGWSVHDLLPICEELNIPLVLDYHHHNIVFDGSQIREGTLDIIQLYDRIAATWKRKGITQKMHYSEPTPAAVTPRQRRKHSARVKTLPPCAPDMDLMIEAKDKEQAVFELMRIFKLPGYSGFSDIIPHTRNDENKPWKLLKKVRLRKKAGDAETDTVEGPEPQPPPIVPDDELSMGGPENRVYWPPGMEEWLRPKKREMKNISTGRSNLTPAKKTKSDHSTAEPEIKASNRSTAVIKSASKPAAGVQFTPNDRLVNVVPTSRSVKKRKTARRALSSSASSSDDTSGDTGLRSGEALNDSRPVKGISRLQTKAKAPVLARRQRGRAARVAVKSYAEDETDDLRE